MLATRRLTITVPDPRLETHEVAEIFNSNPDFIADSEGRTEKTAYTADEVASWPLFTGRLRDHQRLLLVRLREGGQLIGVADLLTPHPRGNYAALGLLILHSDWQRRGLGGEAAEAIESALFSEGWSEVEIVVQRTRPRSRRFWERRGYRLVREGVNENGRQCWIMRKPLKQAPLNDAG